MRTMNEVGISSHFYLLAFINHKFKEEFIKRVLYGKFRLHMFLGMARKLVAFPTRNNENVESQVGILRRVPFYIFCLWD